MRAKILSETDLQKALQKADRMETVMLLLSHKAGLRACEIAALDWRMVLGADGSLADHIDLPAIATKGRTGAGRLPIHRDLKAALLALAACYRFPRKGKVVRGRNGDLSAHAVAQRFKRIYGRAGLEASSHSGRRSLLTRLGTTEGINAFQVQRAARHADISTTRLYVEDAASDRVLADAMLA